MKRSIKNYFLKTIGFFALIGTLPISFAFADSRYDGIWEVIGYNDLYSITITQHTVVVVSIDEVARDQDPLLGTYVGAIPAISSLVASPDHPLSVRVLKIATLPRLLQHGVALSWQIDFLSKDSAMIQTPPNPIMDSMPPRYLRKIF